MSIVYCLGTVIFHVVLSEFGDGHVNESCLTWGREGEGYSAQIQCNIKYIGRKELKMLPCMQVEKKNRFCVSQLQVRRKSTKHGDLQKFEAMVKGCLIFFPRLLYNANNLPRTEQEWNAFTFIDKTHWGYYAWPRYPP